MKSLTGILTIVLSLAFTSIATAARPLLRDGDRVVVVGDSITGQGAGTNGYVGMMAEAMKLVNASTKTTFIPLGGSGHNVGSWRGIIKDSWERNFKLDIPDHDVKTSFDGGADVLIVMLGMNNVLRPDTGNTPEAIKGWAEGYAKLVVALRERAKSPRVIALATPTLCTEGMTSPKNILLDQMSQALAKVAAENNCVILSVREKTKAMLVEGRSRRPDFHLAQDFVHPQPIGHLAIATAMLEGARRARCRQGDL